MTETASLAEPRLRAPAGMPGPLVAWVAAVGLAATLLVGAAAARIALEPPGLRTGLAIGLFLALALAADLKPIPLDEVHDNEVSLAFVFIVSAQILFGWEAAVLVATASILASHVADPRPPARMLFNGGTYALAAFVSAAPGLLFGPAGAGDTLRLTVDAFAGGGLFVSANVVLVSRAIALAEPAPFLPVLRANLRQAAGAFTVMAFLAALAANLWELSPGLIALLAGPLFTVTLYQRSALTSRIARRAALTDSLTGVGNHRAYQERLAEQAERSLEEEEPFSLCLLDVDDFKGINDRFGHPVGDDVLIAFAQALATVEGGTPFRLGGDEFAVIVEAGGEATHARMQALRDELAAVVHPHGQPLTISAGVASFPSHAEDVEELQRVADRALYWSKRQGKDRVFVYGPSIVGVQSPAGPERDAERQARLRAVKNLVRIVDTKDSATGGHSVVASELAEGIGRVLGLDEERVEQLKLAALLHDLGKIGIPDAILQSPDPLTAEEYEVMRKHSELGCSLLEGLELAPVDRWILHHHEHWDGSGYPAGLAGEEIPLESRIILVADAFEAMTADRVYRAARPPAAALAELRAHAGTQFDPTAVDALHELLARGDAPPALLRASA